MGIRPGLSIKGRALRYLAQREHSRAELARKLARFVDDSPEDPASVQIERALDELTARGLLSEQRAAEALVSARSARFGNLKLRHQMHARGIEPEQASSALAAVQDNELERARGVWLRRFGTVAADAAERARQARFLAGRGFSQGIIWRVVHRPADDDGDL